MRLRGHFLLLSSFVSVGAPAMAEPVIKELEVNGVTMTYVEEGTGEPVVFVHGAVSDSRAWEGIRADISDEHRFIAPTLRYFGTGEWSDEGENFSTETHADDVAAFIEALGVGPVHLVGWSYGGQVAMATVLKNPDPVQSLIVFEGAPWNLIQEGEAATAAMEEAGPMFEPVGVAVEEGDAEKATRALIEGVFQMEPGGFDSQPQELKEMQLANARTMPVFWSSPEWAPTCEMLGQLERPTLLVYGGDSVAVWGLSNEGTAACLPQAEVAVLPGVNHDGPVRDPAGFARLIEEFVSKH